MSGFGRFIILFSIAAAPCASPAQDGGEPGRPAIPPAVRTVDELRAAVMRMPRSGAPRAAMAAPARAVGRDLTRAAPAAAASQIREGYTDEVVEQARRNISGITGRNVSAREAIDAFTNPDAARSIAYTQESVVIANAMLRPALLVCSNHLIDAQPVPPFWAPDVRRGQALIDRTLASTGFLSCPENPGDAPGTCFVVGPDLVLTNRHVARSFANVDDARSGPAPLLPNGDSGVFTPTIDFTRFERTCAGASKTAFKVLAIVHIEPVTGLDVALLRVEARDAAGNLLPPPLPLADDTAEARYASSLGNRLVFLAGYPFMDPRESFDARREIFGDEFEVKRLAPGTLTAGSRADGLLAHDCSTLGGNSGSPICDFGTGQVIGLHFRGRSDAKDVNYAVPSWALYKRPQIRAALLGDDDPEPRRTVPVPIVTSPPPDGSQGTHPPQETAPLGEGAPVPYKPGMTVAAGATESAAAAEAAQPAYFMVAFDENGQVVDDAPLRQALGVSPPPSDVFVMSHGWNNSAAEADATYRAMMAKMASVADRFPVRPAGYRPLIVGVRWPSKAWVDDARAAGAANEAARAPGIDPRLVAAIYENFPRGRGSEADYGRDVLRMQELLAKPAADATDMEQAKALYRRYAQPDPDEIESTFGEAKAEAALPAQEAGFTILDTFRVFTYWQMKARAGVVGRNGARSMLERLQVAYPTGRMHLFGHSFGAKVMLAAVGDRRLPRAVDTLVLVQPAVSFLAMAENAAGTNRPGGYRQVAVDPLRVKGPIVVTFSRFDEALNIAYPLASRVAGQVGEQFESAARPDKYSALGAIGAYSSGPRSFGIDMKSVGVAYDNPFSSAIWSVNGGLSSSEFIGGHGDFVKDSVAWLIWSSIRASFP